LEAEMFATERQQAILDLARAAGRVDVPSLSEEFEVTPETIRRDLTSLERRRLLRRTHGGAVAVERVDVEPNLTDRERRHADEKRRIAQVALDELPDEGSIMLDAGSSTAELARMLPEDRELTVVTNGLTVALLLAERRNLTLHVLGGRARGRTLATVDAWAERALGEIFVDVAFLGANGVSVARGLTTPDVTEAMTKRAMIGAARRTVILADHTKFEADAFARFGDLSDVDVIVTDSALDPDLATDVESAGPRVVRA
jgi:DeoR family fructose operon transcriptional repressor